MTLETVVDDATATVGPGAQELESALRGELLRPGDDRYVLARRVYNAMIDRRPAVIVRCAGVADVVEAVGFARARGLLVAVRGGGHNVTGNAVCDDGLVIDLSPMKGIWVDPGARTARVQAGLSWAEVNHELQAFGLAAAGGHRHHRRGGTHARRRPRLAGTQARPRPGQPGVGRGGHGRRSCRHRKRY